MDQEFLVPLLRKFALGLVPGLVLFSALAVGQISPARSAETVSHGDTARFLAGIKPSAASPLSRLTKARSWQNHAGSLDRGWARLDKRQLSKIRAWSASDLPNPAKTLYYMFSGPDYLYANALFPKAKTYVFAGLEPVGTEPQLLKVSPGVRAVGLSRLRSAMNTVLNISFFITNKMKTNLRGTGFKGALPIIYVFLARADKDVQDLAYVKLNKDGTLETLERKSAGQATGVKITFRDKDGGDNRTLYYFRTDISNHGLKRSGFLNFLGTLGEGDAFFKSASYLPHSGNFTTIRNFVLGNARRIVQDDSGIPLRYFKTTDWNFRPYGRYMRPIPIFSGRYQSKMARLFRNKNRKPLKFGIGYRWRLGSSNLLVAEKKTAAAKSAETPSIKPAEAQQAKTHEPAKSTAVD